MATLTSYAEIPLDVLANSPDFSGSSRRKSSVYKKFAPDENLAGSSSREMEKMEANKVVYVGYQHVGQCL